MSSYFADDANPYWQHHLTADFNKTQLLATLSKIGNNAQTKSLFLIQFHNLVYEAILHNYCAKRDISADEISALRQKLKFNFELCVQIAKYCLGGIGALPKMPETEVSSLLAMITKMMAELPACFTLTPKALLRGFPFGILRTAIDYALISPYKLRISLAQEAFFASGDIAKVQKILAEAATKWPITMGYKYAIPDKHYTEQCSCSQRIATLFTKLQHVFDSRTTQSQRTVTPEQIWADLKEPDNATLEHEIFTAFFAKRLPAAELASALQGDANSWGKLQQHIAHQVTFWKVIFEYINKNISTGQFTIYLSYDIESNAAKQAALAEYVQWVHSRLQQNGLTSSAITPWTDAPLTSTISMRYEDDKFHRYVPAYRACAPNDINWFADIAPLNNLPMGTRNPNIEDTAMQIHESRFFITLQKRLASSSGEAVPQEAQEAKAKLF